MSLAESDLDCRQPAIRRAAFASVSLCGGEGQTTVILYPSDQEAQAAKGLIDRLACGGRCCRLHSVVELSRGGGRVRA